MRPYALAVLSLCPVLWLAGVGEATGQQSTDLPNIDRRFESEQIPKPREDRNVPALQTPRGPQPAAQDIQPFILAGVVVEGASAFDSMAFTKAYEDFLAKRVGGPEIETIVGRITKMYTDAGYFLSRAVAPQQEIVGGLVRVRVVEGYFEKVTFAGDYPGKAALRRYTAPIRAARPATMATLERALFLMNDNAGVTIDPSVEPIDEAAGEYELIVQLNHKAVDAFGRLDNRGTPEVGRLQGWLGASVNSLFGFGERIGATFITVPSEPEELLYGALSGDIPIGAYGTSLSLFGAYSTIDAGSSSEPLQSESRSYQVIGRLSHPLIRSKEQNLWVNGSFDFRNFKEEQFGSTVISDRLRTLRLGATYQLQDRFKGQTRLSVGVSQGLDILDASDNSSNKRSRSNGRSDFTKVAGDLVRRQTVTDLVAVQAAVAGQWAAVPLLSYEEFAVGGEQFGRAYDFSEISGEHGVAGSVEVQFGRKSNWRWLDEYQLYGFYDAGAVWNMVTGNSDVRSTLSSAGAGMRVKVFDKVQANFEAAKPLEQDVNTEDDNDWRFFFTTTVTY